MAALPDGLLDAVKSYLNITWQDDVTEEKLTGYINRGMTRLHQIAGASLDFTKEDQPRALLLDYCRYANSQALEVFEKNFEAELLDLHLRTQAPVIDSLTILISAESESAVSAVVAPALDEGNSYVYQVGTSLSVPNRLDVCADSDWSVWDGIEEIAAAAGQEIMIAEMDGMYRAKRAGKVTV